MLRGTDTRTNHLKDVLKIRRYNRWNKCIIITNGVIYHTLRKAKGNREEEEGVAIQKI